MELGVPSTLKCFFGSQHRMKMPFGSCPCSLLVLEICPEIVWNGVVGPEPNNAVKKTNNLTPLMTEFQAPGEFNVMI